MSPAHLSNGNVRRSDLKIILIDSKIGQCHQSNYQLYLSGQVSRGIKIEDTLTIELQRATTKVKFKQALKPLCRY